MSELSRRTLILIMSILAISACERTKPSQPGKPVVQKLDNGTEVVVGPRTSEILGRPDQVRAYRIMMPFDPSFAAAQKTHPLIGGYPILAEAPVSSGTYQKISALLLDPSSYDPNYAFDCLFKPRHALRFQRGTDTVDVIICFECSDLDIIPSPSLRERQTSQPFGRVAKPLYTAMLEVFPERPGRKE